MAGYIQQFTPSNKYLDLLHLQPVAVTSVRAHLESLKQCNIYTVAQLFLFYSQYGIYSRTILTTGTSLHNTAVNLLHAMFAVLVTRQSEIELIFPLGSNKRKQLHVRTATNIKVNLI